MRGPRGLGTSHLTRNREVQSHDTILVEQDPVTPDEMGNRAGDGGVQERSRPLGSLLAKLVVMSLNPDPYVGKRPVWSELAQRVDEVPLGAVDLVR